jgi:hypothetical protein
MSVIEWPRCAVLQNSNVHPKQSIEIWSLNIPMFGEHWMLNVTVWVWPATETKAEMLYFPCRRHTVSLIKMIYSQVHNHWHPDLYCMVNCWGNYFYLFVILPPFSWYPIGSSSYLVSSLQLPYGLGRDKGRKPCVLRNTTQPSRTAS